LFQHANAEFLERSRIRVLGDLLGELGPKACGDFMQDSLQGLRPPWSRPLRAGGPVDGSFRAGLGSWIGIGCSDRWPERSARPQGVRRADISISLRSVRRRVRKHFDLNLSSVFLAHRFVGTREGATRVYSCLSLRITAPVKFWEVIANIRRDTGGPEEPLRNLFFRKNCAPKVP